MSLPKKWCILTNGNNIQELDKFYKKHIDEYKDCRIEWSPGMNAYFHYPQFQSGAHSCVTVWAGYKQISFEEFKKSMEPTINNTYSLF